MHLENHDVSFVRVSRAPFAEIEAYRKRMGWRAKWVSSNGNDFNYDYHVSLTPEEIEKGEVYYNYDVRPFASEELSGISVFYKRKGDVFHTYSTYARGDELVDSTYMLLDMTPLGRNETAHTTTWVTGYGDTTNAEPMVLHNRSLWLCHRRWRSAARSAHTKCAA